MVERLVRAYSITMILLAAFAFVVFKFFYKHVKTVIAITFPVFLFIKLSEELIEKELSVFDNRIYQYISGFISEDTTDVMKFISFLGSRKVLVLISLVTIFIFWKNNKYSFYSKMVAVNLLASSILNETLKQLFHRERPDILRLVKIGGFSFPSGHSMVGLSFYGFIAYLCYVNLKSKWKYPIIVILCALIFSIGISRIYLGVHYASDVVAGFSAGFAWLVIFITLINKINLLKKRG